MIGFSRFLGSIAFIENQNSFPVTTRLEMQRAWCSRAWAQLKPMIVYPEPTWARS